MNILFNYDYISKIIILKIIIFKQKFISYDKFMLYVHIMYIRYTLTLYVFHKYSKNFNIDYHSPADLPKDNHKYQYLD